MTTTYLCREQCFNTGVPPGDRNIRGKFSLWFDRMYQHAYYTMQLFDYANQPGFDLANYQVQLMRHDAHAPYTDKPTWQMLMEIPTYHMTGQPILVEHNCINPSTTLAGLQQLVLENKVCVVVFDKQGRAVSRGQIFAHMKLETA